MRFSDVRWVAETGSTNADVMALARDGAPEGIVLVADHQTAGRGRQGRTWTAPAGASLLASILLRPPAVVAGLSTMAVAVSATRAIDEVLGIAPGIKWPNDLVWPGDGSGPDRKLAGILAEADWPARSQASAGWSEPPPHERVAVVVGIGLNVNWPTDLPEELADVAVALNHITGSDVDRHTLLDAMLRQLDDVYGQLVDSGGEVLMAEARQRSATIGRRVRVELGADEIEGIATAVSDDGRLEIETADGHRRLIAVGDVIHLRVQ